MSTLSKYNYSEEKLTTSSLRCKEMEKNTLGQSAFGRQKVLTRPLWYVAASKLKATFNFLFEIF